MFMIQQNGQITNLQVVDYEARDQKRFTLSVRVSETFDTSGGPQTLSSTSTMQLDITDENDNKPQFTQPQFLKSVPENFGIGEAVLEVTATDLDSGQNGEIEFSVPEDGYFSITTRSEERQSGNIVYVGVITVKSKLDYDEPPGPNYEFPVTATDKGMVPNQSTAQVTVSVTNVNDNPPEIDNSTSPIQLLERASVGFIVTLVRATEKDGDVFTFFLSPSSEARDIFSVADTGLVRTIAEIPPDVESYTLIIGAQDDGSCCGGTSSQTSTAVFRIDITDVNQNKPEFTQCSTFENDGKVKELSPPGTAVVQVQATDSDRGENGRVIYRIVSPDPNGVNAPFEINSSTGQITVKNRFHRGDGYLQVTVAGRNPSDVPLMEGWCTFRVTIEDINDHAPRFSQNEFSVDIPVTATVNYFVRQMEATDEDVGVNANITYSIASSSNSDGYFHINGFTGVLSVNKRLDETIDRYVIVVIADDNGIDPGSLTSNTTVNININRATSTRPQWIGVQDQENFNVKETEGIGYVIAQLRCDSNIPSRPAVDFIIFDSASDISFSSEFFSYRKFEADGHQFMNLTLLKKLDFLESKEHRINIVCRNTGEFSEQVNLLAKISVIDENDQTPVFKGLSGCCYEGSIPEDAPAGSTVVRVSAEDKDETPLFKKITFGLAGEEAGLFNIVNNDDNTATIITTQALANVIDRETQASYDISVTAKDGAPAAYPLDPNHPDNPNEATSRVVHVSLTDVNDNSPRFEKPLYKCNASELLTVYEVVCQVVANDPDEIDIVRGLEYFFTSGNTLQTFSTSISGEIRVARRLDYEKTSEPKQYDLTLIARDEVGHENQTQVQINVIDENDNKPVFDQREYMVYETFIEEDNSISSSNRFYLTTVSAKDADKRSETDIRYKLSGSLTSGINQRFTIDEVTGEIFLIGPLDREDPLNNNPTFSFNAIAEDERQNPNLGYTTVKVTPGDINDNSPTFDEAYTSGKVNEHAALNTPVFTIVARDPDAGLNGTVHYRMAPQQPNSTIASYFRIIAENGNVLTNTDPVNLDRETTETMSFIVEAYDQGVPPLSTNHTVTVTLSDINDQSPYFQQPIYRHDMSEHTTSGEILRIQAIDEDSEPRNKNLRYEILNGVSFFGVQTSDNVAIIYVNQPVDYEEDPREFNFTLRVTDGVATHVNTTEIFIKILDFNDNAPQFVRGEISVTVTEEQAPGPLNVQFSATDLDSGINKEFTFSVVRESDPFYEFYIEPTSGEVFTRKPLDRELGDKREVIIMAKDKGEIPLNSTAKLIVNLIDINDNAPSFLEDYLPKVEENQDHNNFVVVEVFAKDPDAPPHADPFYFSLPGNCNVPACTHFTLTYNPAGQGSAFIRTSSRFDREEQKQYYLPILISDMYEVNDPNTESLTSTNTLTIVIGDENDNMHKPGHQDITVFSYEDKFADIEVGRVYTEDPDDWDLPDKTFRFIGPEVMQNYFTVNEADGAIIMLAGVPVTTGRAAYRFEVDVYDQKFMNTERCSVAVTVLPLSDEAVRKSGAVRLSGITAEEFIIKHNSPTGPKSKYDEFKEEVAKLLGYNPNGDHVLITSLSDGPGYLDVMYSAHGSPYLNPSQVESAVMLKQPEMVQNLGVGIDQNPINLCMDELYDDGCSTNFDVTGQPVLKNSNGTSYVGAEVLLSAESGCKDPMFPQPQECRGDYCFNGGTCKQDDWGKLTCACLPGFDGPRCQQLRHHFDGSSVSFYKGLSVCAEGRTTFEFITEKDDGILMYTGPISKLDDSKDFMSLQLVGGFPEFRINLGAGELLLALNGIDRSGFQRLNKLSDGKWHRIDIDRENQRFQLTIDHCEVAEADATGVVLDWTPCRTSGSVLGGDILLNVATFLQLGGRYFQDNVLPDYPPNLGQNGFTGCVKNLMHDSKLYDLHYKEVPNWNSGTNGCPDEETICGEDSATPFCGKHSTCISEWQPSRRVIDCTCKPGWYGNKCEKEAPIRDLKWQSFFKWQLDQNTIDESVRDNSIDLMFRTRETSGNLFTMTNVGQATILLQIRDGRLQLTYDMGPGSQTVALNNAMANTGQWHTVHVRRHGNELSLRMDGGEGRKFNFRPIEEGVKVIFRPLAYISVGARLPPVPGQVNVPGDISDDLISTCIRDVRINDEWLPMTLNGNSDPAAGATLLKNFNTSEGCVRNDCVPDPCGQGNCTSLWEAYECRCPFNTLELAGGICPSPCLDNPCFNGVKCTVKDNQAVCDCPKGMYGQYCNQLAVVDDDDGALSAGLIALIVIAILLLLILVILLVLYIVCRRKKPDSDNILKVDPDDDFIRENVIFYDEEGAGEEDHQAYDISLLTRPDREAPLRPFNAPITESRPARESAPQEDPRMDRPDVGSFINKRIEDAENPDDDPFNDSTREFAFEGANSEAGSLSSLASSSTDGSQDYDFLSGWGDKFARLADMYGAGQNLDD
ncbi:neural-cadherin [Aplysia californica]|uniref:Neural-cadherin n=1 Tax=Aplysia californica TaxID=6500 RepID=A0ABM0JAB2_APLCA|nr:neural-cadherin [Aplysia californica]